MKINLVENQRTQTLWCFVLFAFGIALYFGLPFEPSFWLLAGISVVLLGWVLWRPNMISKFIFFLCFGLTIACGRTCLTRTHFIQAPFKKQTLMGEVVTAYSNQKGQTVLLQNVALNGDSGNPGMIRVTFKDNHPKLRPNDVLTFVGNLNPPTAKQALRFFFQGIVAQGTIKQILNQQSGNTNFLDTWRTKIMNRLRDHLTRTQAEIAIPLVTGEQQVVSPTMYEVYRKAGIAHVLSVSGFHMTLLAGFVFFLIRGLLALLMKTEAFISSKKLAALVAFFVTAFYLLISGCQVPAIRSFMMISLVFLGILTDRKAISLYNLLLVGFCVLMVRPEWMTSVSFQFSFVAVMILVGLFEDVSKRIENIRFFHIFLATIVANILITFALAPFVAFHFNQFNPYGVVGNLMTGLLFSVFIMPMLFLGVLLMPFHLEAPLIKSAGYGLDIVTAIAQKIAEFPFSEIIVPSFSAWGLGIVAFGLCFLCLVKGWKRTWGFGFVLAGLCVGIVFQSKPDLIVSNYGNTILVRNDIGLFDIKGKQNSWAARRWLKQNGQTSAKQLDNTALFIKGYRIALDEADCKGADLAILHKKTNNCSAKDIFRPRRNTNYQLFLEDKIIIHSEEYGFVHRPWTISLHPKRNN